MDSGEHDSDGLRRARAKWLHVGRVRPGFAVEPGPGQESVWDYPRPPRCEPERRQIRVVLGSTLIARTHAAIRVVETGGAPTFYIPPADVRTELLVPEPGPGTVCEWKGTAVYFGLRVGAERVHHAAWCYRAPFEAFRQIAGFIAFYPDKVDGFVDDERARPQPGGYYGGWVTRELAGPIKGEPGTEDW